MIQQILTYDKSEDTPIKVVISTVIGTFSLFFIAYEFIN